jgi:hypothetical protein
MGMQFLSGVVKMFWNQTMVITAQLYEYTQKSMNDTT